MRELVVGQNDAGQRLDKFLSKTLRDLPRSLLYKAVRTKKIKVNRARAEIGQILKAGDTLQLFLAEEFFGAPTDRSAMLTRMAPRLSVVYEDENILLLCKPMGVSCHEDEDNSINNLLVQMQAYLYQKGEYHPEEEQSFAPALCNRIDRNTAGIVIAAKNAEALRVMNEMIRAREVGKYYLCAVRGCPKPPAATLSAWLVRHRDEKRVEIFDERPKSGEPLSIATAYRVLAENTTHSLLLVELLTGRTHQIRAHLAHIGHPLLGDGKYGKNAADRALGYHHQALVSYRLTFKQGFLDTPLSYLAGKSFTLAPSEVYFLKEFPDFSPNTLAE